MDKARKFSPRTTALGTAALAFAGVALLATPALADSSVYVTNNTGKEIVLKTNSTLGSKHWKKKATVIPPFSRREIYETSRHDGVKNGKTFLFNSEVHVRRAKDKAVLSQHPDEFQLRLKLRGTAFHSHMWQGVRTQAGSESWADDRQKYGSKMNVKGKRWNVTYWAYGTGEDDNVEFVIRENYPKPMGYGKRLTKDWHADHLNILSYNLYMRPTSLFHNGQMKRAKLIPDQFPGYDVIVFQEAFDDDVRAELIRGMKKKGYKYVSNILGTDRGTEQDGGVIVVSRYPIVKQKQRLFKDACIDSDCLADKGVLYVKINKKIGGKNNYYHVFGTHLNTGGPTKKKNVQKRQLRIMRDFIKAQRIPKDQGVLMAGDFNINRTDTAMYDYMLNTLNAGYFTGGKLRGWDYTSDGSINDLTDSGASYLDYVLYSKQHRGIMTSSFAEVRVPRAHMEWKQYAHEKAMWDLSDHFAVYGNFHFADDLGFDPGYDPNPSNDGPIICQTNADCPGGMECERKAGGNSGSTGSSGSSGSSSKRTVKSRPTARSIRPVRGARGKPKAPASRRMVKSKKLPSRGLKRIAGICRVPPPK